MARSLCAILHPLLSSFSALLRVSRSFRCSRRRDGGEGVAGGVHRQIDDLLVVCEAEEPRLELRRGKVDAIGEHRVKEPGVGLRITMGRVGEIRDLLAGLT